MAVEVKKFHPFHPHLSQVRAIYRQHQSNKAADDVANGGDTVNVNGSATMNGGSGNSKQGK